MDDNTLLITISWTNWISFISVIHIHFTYVCMLHINVYVRYAHSFPLLRVKEKFNEILEFFRIHFADVKKNVHMMAVFY